jgi:hypothetical protein
MAALGLASLAFIVARGARRHTRRLQATLEEMVSLMEVLTERPPVAPGGYLPEATGSVTAPGARSEAALLVTAPSSTGAGVTDVRQRVIELDAAGASRSAICRETGLSHGEVTLLLAMTQRMGGVA